MKDQSETPKSETNGSAASANGVAKGTAQEPEKAPEKAASKSASSEKSENVTPLEPPKTASAAKPQPSFKDSGATVSTPPPSGTSGQTSGASTGNMIMLVIAAVLGGALVLLLLQGFGSGGGTEDIAADLKALESRLDAAELGNADADVAQSMRGELNTLNERVEALETARAQRIRPGSVPQDLNDALQRLESNLAQVRGEATRAAERLTGRLDNLEAVLPENLREVLENKAEKPEVSELQARVVSLEQNDVANDARRAALAIALANLTRASGDSAPFDVELEAISVLVKDDEIVEGLRSYAAEGLPSPATLASRFDATGREIVRAYESSKSMGIFGRLWANIIAMLTIRPTGEVTGDSPPAIVARAERRLKDGDLTAAVQELDKLQDEPAEAASPWLDQARARLDLNRLIGELNTRIIASLRE